MIKILVTTLGALMLFGCASGTSPGTYTVKKEMIFDRSFDATWTKIIDWFGTNNIDIDVLEKDSGIITAGTKFPLDGYYDCGEPAFDKYYGTVAGTFNVTAKPEGDGTKVRLNTNFQVTVYTKNGLGQPIGAGIPMRCNSRGTWESEIFEALR